MKHVDRAFLGYVLRHNIMKTCINCNILHNMSIKDEHDDSLDNDYDAPKNMHLIQLSREPTLSLHEFIARHRII